MSESTRQALVAKLTVDPQQRADLLDPGVTSTWLIQMLTTLVTDLPDEPIEITAVRRDHPTPDGKWAHAGGLAVDLIPKNWQGREEEAFVNVMEALAENPYCKSVGLGGDAWGWESYVTWPTVQFIVFQDNASTHIHCGAANAVDPPGPRPE